MMAGLLTRGSWLACSFPPRLGQWILQVRSPLTVAGAVTDLAANAYTTPYSLFIRRSLHLPEPSALGWQKGGMVSRTETPLCGPFPNEGHCHVGALKGNPTEQKRWTANERAPGRGNERRCMLRQEACIPYGDITPTASLAGTCYSIGMCGKQTIQNMGGGCGKVVSRRRK